ncbi:MAG: hypothetical protein JXM70_18755, partial [Pirellulales bacterium]|nr:hypothetical protein [Pirellulales bacterium]
GDYRIEMWPKLGGKLWKEGPSIVYHRRKKDFSELLISPYAPWRLQRDSSRPELRLGSETPQPGIVQPELEGMYAVFARPQKNCFVRVGSKGLVRLVQMPQAPGSEYTFIAARDLSGEGVEIFEEKNSPSRLESLLFVPVTKESVEQFYTEAGSPPTPLNGVNDWCCYFFGPVRYNADQFETLLGGQAELGLRTIDWSIGRSWIEYHTDLKNTTRFPCVPLEDAVKKYPKAAIMYEGRIRMINEFRPLESVFAAREKFDVKIWPWLSMQRFYGTWAYGGLFASNFYRANLDKCRCPKNTDKPRQGEMSYWFEEVRQERVAILLDVAEKGADGLLVGCCRQVPMLLYHPKMVAAYQAETGIDPRKIDASSPEEYRRWITWRADFFTRVLRDLKKGLAKIEKEQNRKIPVAVRIPSAGLYFNLAQGLDVEKWCKEGLIDSLQVEPLDVRIYPEGSHDIRPYLELRQRYGIRVLGGIGATWDFDPEGIVPALKRARGLIEAKVDGIEIYETEWQARSKQTRWIVPLMGNLHRIDALLNESNLEACYPIHSTNATYGHDNHSFGNGGWSTYGSGMMSL